MKKKLVVTYDFPGAYLNSRREGRAEKVYMKFNRFHTNVLTKLEPSWKYFTLSDGTSRAEVTGALYGLIESGALWNQDSVLLFNELGYTQSKYDQCVFYKQGVRIVLYVDDLYITYETEELIKDFKEVILKRFGGEFKLPIDDTVEFLGMKIKKKMEAYTSPCRIELMMYLPESLVNHQPQLH